MIAQRGKPPQILQKIDEKMCKIHFLIKKSKKIEVFRENTLIGFINEQNDVISVNGNAIALGCDTKAEAMRIAKEIWG
jgi:hypothetical protein